MRTNDSQIGPIRKLILKLLTKLQELTINSQSGELYRFFTSLHFRVYSGSTLDKCVISDDISQVDMFAKAAHRHGNMVASLVYKNSDNKTKKAMQKAAVSSFTKDYLLDKEV